MILTKRRIVRNGRVESSARGPREEGGGHESHGKEGGHGEGRATFWSRRPPSSEDIIPAPKVF